MKKLTRKLFISILSMAFAVIAIGTTTFAWITISTTAEVDTFDANVEAGAGGIELSWDGSTGWTTLLLNAKDHYNTGFKGFSDICYDRSNGNSEGFYDMKINGQTAVKETIADGNNEKYVTFTFYVKNTNANTPITLKVTGTTFDSYAAGGVNTPNPFVSDIAFSYGESVNVTAASEVSQFVVANAARMMIKAGNSSPVIYEKAAVDGNTVHAEIDQTKGAAHAYFKAKNYNFGTLSNSEYDTYKNNQEAELCTIQGGAEPVAITVTIWIEGWDNECHANILSQVLKSSISLEAVSSN